MIKAIVFDCFGVLTEDGWLAFRAKHFPKGSEALDEAHSLNRQVDAGLIDYDTFIERIALLAQTSEAQVRQATEQVVPNAALLSYIAAELKPHYKIGLLSNVSGNWLNRLFSDDQIALFDATALSYELGVIKPHPKTYQTIAARLDVLPEEAIFIDDQERYVTGAIEEGMRAFVYRNFAQFKHDLSQTLE